MAAAGPTSDAPADGSPPRRSRSGLLTALIAVGAALAAALVVFPITRDNGNETAATTTAATTTARRRG